MIDTTLFERQKVGANPKTEVAGIYSDGNLCWHIGFYIPRFKFLDSFFETWQFYQKRTLPGVSGKFKLSHYRLAMVGMKKQLEEWIGVIDMAIEKYGDIEPE